MAAQVKVAGYKVNLDKVTETLKTNEVIDDAIAVVDQDSQQLVAYVTSSNEAAADEKAFAVKLQQWLNLQLPSHMVPTGFKVVDAIHINQLPAPILLGQLKFEPPQNELEQALAQVWRELLDVEQISRFDNFFAIGGNSLSSIRLEFAISQEFEVEVSVRELFEHPELASQARLIASKNRGNENDGASPQAITAVSREQALPLSFAQQRLWFIDQLKGSTHYNVPHFFKVSGDFDEQCFEQALTAMIRRHEILRTVYREVEGQAEQIIVEDFHFAVQKHDLSQFEGEGLENEIIRLTQIDLTTPFNLSQDVMLRVNLFKLSSDSENSERVILLNVHHIAFDVRVIIAVYQ